MYRRVLQRRSFGGVPDGVRDHSVGLSAWVACSLVRGVSTCVLVEQVLRRGKVLVVRLPLTTWLRSLGTWSALYTSVYPCRLSRRRRCNGERIAGDFQKGEVSLRTRMFQRIRSSLDDLVNLGGENWIRTSFHGWDTASVGRSSGEEAGSLFVNRSLAYRESQKDYAGFTAEFGVDWSSAAATYTLVCITLFVRNLVARALCWRRFRGLSSTQALSRNAVPNGTREKCPWAGALDYVCSLLSSPQ